MKFSLRRIGELSCRSTVQALRSLWAHRGHLAVNASGLAVGLAASFLIWMFAYYELTFDSKLEHIYRIAATRDSGAGSLALSSAALRPLLQGKFSGLVEDSTLLQAPSSSVVLVHENKRVLDVNVQAADGNIGDFFPIRMLVGDAEALAQPDRVLLSEHEAIRLFGKTDVVGAILSVEFGDKRETLSVAGVFAFDNERSHVSLDVLYSLATLERHWPFAFSSLFESNNFALYVRMKPGASPVALEYELEALFRAKTNRTSEYTLQAVRDIRLNPKQIGEFKQQGDGRLVNIGLALAALILAISICNFVSFATAYSLRRAKEVGLYKSLGARRRELILQFMMETALTVTAALCLALILAALGYQLIEAAGGRPIPFVIEWPFVAGVVGATLLVILFAGTYPAVFFSSFRPRTILSRELIGGKRAVVVRAALLTTEALVATVLITLSLAANMLLEKLRSEPLGFDPSGVLVSAPVAWDVARPSVGGLEARFKSLGMANVAYAEQVPTMPFNMQASTLSLAVSSVRLESVPIIGASDNIARALGVDIAAGRDFTADYVGDRWRMVGKQSAEVGLLINEALAKSFGLGGPAARELVGQVIEFEWMGIRVAGRIAGVLKDFKFSAHVAADEPLMFANSFFYQGDVTLVMRNERMGTDAVSVAKRIIEESLGISGLQVSELRELVERQFEARRQQLLVTVLFTAVSVLLTLFGIIGLTLYIAESKKREISIRRTQGAMVHHILWVLGREYVAVVLLSAIASVPIVRYLCGIWLRDLDISIADVFQMHLAASLLITVAVFAALLGCTAYVTQRNPLRGLARN